MYRTLIHRHIVPVLERLVYGPDKSEGTTAKENHGSKTSAIASSRTELPGEKLHQMHHEMILPLAVDEEHTTEKRRKAAVFRWRTLFRKSEGGWHPTIFHSRPLVGIGALCVAVGCVFTSLAILLMSDGSPVDDWPIYPTVYSAIVAAIANSALALARMENQNKCLLHNFCCS